VEKSTTCDYNTTTIAVVKGTKTKIAPGVWRLRVYIGRNAKGNPVQRSKTIHTGDKNAKPGAGTRLADRELANMIAEANKGNTATGTETVSDLLDLFLDHKESTGRSPETLRGYRQIANAVVRPELGTIKLSRLTARDLDRLYAKLRAKGNAAMTVRHVHTFIGTALHQGERWQLVKRNVARQATPPTVHPVEVVAPSPDEVRRVIEAAESIEPTLATLLLLAALTGARRGELCALRWSDVDWHRGTIRIARSIYEVLGGGWAEKATKTHATRRIGVDDFGLAILRRHREGVDELANELDLTIAPDGFLFSRSPAGLEPIRPGVVSKFTRRVADRAGVDTHLHALRHFSATQAIAAGFDPVTVGTRLGHADPSITLRVYSHALEQRDRDLAASLGKVLALPT
jgi:integrase